MTDRETPLSIPKWQPAYSSGGSGSVPPMDYMDSTPLGVPAHRHQEAIPSSGGIDALALMIGMSFILMILLTLLLLSRC